MNVVDNSKMLKAIDWARKVEAKLRNLDAETANAVKKEIDDFQQQKLNIAVVGLLKRGKSTFCNAFLGRDNDLIAPVDRLPATGVISEFIQDNHRDYAKVVFNDGSSCEIEYKDIRSYVTEEENPENRKNVKVVEVYGKFDLDNEIKLIDLPGDESIHVYHSEIVYNYLPLADIIIFLSSADDPISQQELALLKKVQPNDFKKIFFVINKIDRCDPADVDDAEKHNRATIDRAGIKIENDIYRISAKNVISKRGCSGFDSLTADIKSFLTNERVELKVQSFCGRITALSQHIINDLKQQETFYQLDEAELNQKIIRFKEDKATMTAELKKGLQDFSDSWDGMLEEFEGSLPKIQSNVEEVLIKEVEAMPALGLSKKKLEEMPDKIASTLESEFKTSSNALQEKAVVALEKLEKSCPAISEFLADQNYNITVQSAGGPGTGSWVFTIMSGATAYITGSAISGAFAIGGTWGTGGGLLGTGAAILGKMLGTAAGTIVTAILGPLFLVSTIGVTVAFGGIIFSTFRKKKLQKEQLIREVKSNIKNAIDDIRMNRIPYLREQKEVLIKEITKGFDNIAKKTNDNLREALEQKNNNTSNRLLSEQRQIAIKDFEELHESILQEVKR